MAGFKVTAVSGLAIASLALAACEQNEPAKMVTDGGTGSVEPVVATTQRTANEDVLAMVDRHAAAVLKLSPETATRLGVSDAVGTPGYHGRLGDYSALARDEMMELNDRFYSDLQQIEAEDLSGTAAVTYDVMSYAYKMGARRNQFSFGRGTAVNSTSPYLIHQLSGPHIGLPRLLLTQHPMKTSSDFEAYVARLEAFGGALTQTDGALRLDAEAGVVPPFFALKGAARSITELTAAAPEDHLLIQHLKTAMDDVDLPEDQQAALLSQAETAVTSGIYPAYAELRDTLLSLESAAGTDAGVWRLDEGAAFYQHALDSYGAGGKTPEEVHQLGLSEVDRISAEMNSIMDTINVPKAETAGLRFALMSEDPASIYPNTEAGKDLLLAALRAQVTAINKLAPEWFGTLPPQSVEVRRIPTYEQDSAPGGYYTSPSLDGTRPGIYWINLKDTADWPKYTLKTLTYHEAVPGHHFQVALQQAVEDMPLSRNMMFYSEYGEGWALYAEKVAAEMGMYADDPQGNLGRLQAELFRAARLVVDTGLHHHRWTRDDAIAWMVKTTGDTEAAVTREIERYAVWPGQATSYKLGMVKFEELRARAEAELGDQFDIRTFHDALLLDGSMPLPVLEARMDAWIKTQSAQ